MSRTRQAAWRLATELVVRGEKDPAAPAPRLLTRAAFQGLAAVPAEVEWFANLQNPRTRRAYQIDLADFAKV